MEDQPLPVDASPTALSPGYIADFYPEEDEEDPEEDPVDHPIDGGDNDDNESSDDDDNDDDVVKDEEDEEEEEHLAPANPSVETMTTVNQGMSVEEIERVVAQRVANTIKAIAMNVGIKGTAGVIARSKRTETMKTKLEVKDKSEKKRLKGVPIVRDFPEVFPEDFPWSSSRTRQVDYKIELCSGAKRPAAKRNVFTMTIFVAQEVDTYNHLK
ncbi:hypothetical protein Tco_0432233 [Tanacetum coccineum]